MCKNCNNFLYFFILCGEIKITTSTTTLAINLSIFSHNNVHASLALFLYQKRSIYAKVNRFMATLPFPNPSPQTNSPSQRICINIRKKVGWTCPAQSTPWRRHDYNVFSGSSKLIIKKFRSFSFLFCNYPVR